MSDRLFLIFEHWTAHPVVYLSCAPDPLDAISNYIRDDSGVQFNSDGSLEFQDDGKQFWYPHPLAYIEANFKLLGEWQIREVPKGATEARLTEAFCGEDPSDVEYHLSVCRRLLRRERPRSRARGFLWYVQDGVIVTFYRKTGPFQIEVLGRYVRRWNGDGDYVP